MKARQCLLGMALLFVVPSVSVAGVYRDAGRFRAALGAYDLVDFDDVSLPPGAMQEISGDRYVGSHGMRIEPISPGGIWLRSTGPGNIVGNIHPSGSCRGEFRVSFEGDESPETVTGFGCWFGDVDTENMSGIWLYDAYDNYLDGGYVEAGGQGVWTFVGATGQDVAYANVIFNDVPGGVAMEDYAFGPVLAQAGTVLNFDDLPVGSTVDSNYRSKGALFSMGCVVHAYGEPGFGTNIGSPPHCLAVFEQPLRIDFVVPGTDIPGTTDNVSVWMSDNSVGSLLGVLYAYDADGLLIDHTETSTPGTREQVLHVEGEGIAYVLIRADIDGSILDSIDISVPVPEPGTLSLLAIGGLVVVGTRSPPRLQGPDVEEE